MKTVFSVVMLLSLVGCTEKSDAAFRAELVTSIHDSIDADLANLVKAARNIQAAAPSRAWNPATDAAAIDEMREAWKRTRTAYEHVEGAIAPLFSGLESTIDGRYDDYLAGLGPQGDGNPFDGSGVVGMHAIERILYAPMMRPEVLEFERALPGYQVAAYPSTDDQAIAFKTELVERLIEDASELHADWQPASVDLAAAYHGLVGLMNEQKEKVNLAASGEEESRYANITLFDLRNNLQGTQNVYGLFREWIQTKPMGEQADETIRRRFDMLATLYDTPSDALPAVPPDWNADSPTAANLATPFGELWQMLHDSVDPHSDESVVTAMNHVATLLGFPEFVAP